MANIWTGGTESELSFELAPWQQQAKKVLEAEATTGRQGILSFADLLQRQRLRDEIERARRMSSDELLRTSGRAGMSANIPQGMRDINESGISSLIKGYNDQLLAKRQGAMGIYNTLFQYAGTPKVTSTSTPGLSGVFDPGGKMLGNYAAGTATAQPSAQPVSQPTPIQTDYATPVQTTPTLMPSSTKQFSALQSTPAQTTPMQTAPVTPAQSAPVTGGATGSMQGIGSLLGGGGSTTGGGTGMGGILGLIMKLLLSRCWVAREVYGADNPQWVQFYVWKEYVAPRWFKYLYNKYGEKFALWIHDKPKIKSVVKRFMDSRIKSMMKSKSLEINYA